MKGRTSPLRVSGIALLVSLHAVSAAGQDAYAKATFQELVQSTLESRALHPVDVSLPTDPVPGDPFRLVAVDSVLTNPLAIRPWSRALIERLRKREARHGSSCLLREARGLLLRTHEETTPRGSGSLDPALKGRLEAAVDGSFLDLVTTASRALSESRESLFSHLTEEDSQVLWKEALRLLEESREDRDKDLFTLEREKWETAAWGERLLSSMASLDLDSYLDLGIDVIGRLEAKAAGLVDDWPASADTVLRIQRPEGAVLVGTRGDDIFRGSAAVVLDPGGNDLYLLDPPERPIPLSVIVDLGGNDTYQGGDKAPFASGFFGVALLVDEAGDDTYEAGSFSLGAGWCGIGYLRDASGFDTYRGDLFAEGAGCCGIGLLWDVSGGDSYAASMESQGFGFVGGVGILRDSDGRDLYSIQPYYTDVLRYQDHVLSLSQGFGYGWRPDWSGGVGILWDEKGHDVYLADIFGQGGSYWFGLGLLADEEGHDTYAGFQYVQGSGVHLGVGVLWDGRGNDSYLAKGVSQGCGHDWAPGFLLDESGEDVYVAADLSQGAGSANGFGLLWDGGGNDAYCARDSVSTQGYGNPRRGYGSIGLVLDAAGRDHFHNRSERTAAVPREEWWADPSRWGAVVDFPGSSPDEAAWPPDEPLPVPEHPYSVAELFAMASSGEPKFRLFRERGVEELKRRDSVAVDSLLHLLGTPDARDRNTLREILSELDTLSLGPLMRVLRDGGPDPSWEGEELAPAPPRDPVSLSGWRRRERRLVCEILGRMKRSEATSALLPLLEDPHWTVRSAAAEAVGRIGDPAATPETCALLRDSHPQVRVKAASSLARMGSETALGCLTEALGDPFFGVRWIAARALAQSLEERGLLLDRLDGGDEDLWIMAVDLTCCGDSVTSDRPFSDTTCAIILNRLLARSPSDLTRGGRSLAPSLRRLAGFPTLPARVRDGIETWLDGVHGESTPEGRRAPSD